MNNETSRIKDEANGVLFYIFVVSQAEKAGSFSQNFCGQLPVVGWPLALGQWPVAFVEKHDKRLVHGA